MLRLHKASWNVANLLNYSRISVQRSTRCISNFNTNSNASHNKQFLNGSGLSNLQKFRAFPGAATIGQMKLYSTDGGKKGNPEEEVEEIEVETEPTQDFVHTHLPATVAIPEVWPYLPCIATSRNPVFPRFMKILEVSSSLCFLVHKFLSSNVSCLVLQLSDPVLIDIIRRKVRLNQPYVGIFLKKDEENKNEIVQKLSDV